MIVNGAPATSWGAVENGLVLLCQPVDCRRNMMFSRGRGCGMPDSPIHGYSHQQTAFRMARIHLFPRNSSSEGGVGRLSGGGGGQWLWQNNLLAVLAGLIVPMVERSS